MRAVAASGTRAEHVRQALDLNRMEAGEIRPPKTLSSPASSPKKRSVPLLSSHRFSARAASGGVGFLFSFALSASLCVFLTDRVYWIATQARTFSRAAPKRASFSRVKQHAREGVSRVVARKRRNLSRGSTQEKEPLACRRRLEFYSRAAPRSRRTSLDQAGGVSREAGEQAHAEVTRRRELQSLWQGALSRE